MPFRRLAAAFLLAALAAVSAGADAADARARVSAKKLSDHVHILSSDAFEGRGPGTAAEQKTIDYIVRQFARARLRPGGDGGAWTQDVPAYRYTLDGPVAATLAGRSGRRSLASGEDVLLYSRNPGSRVEIADAPLVFVGYAIDAPDRHWDDFKGADLKGKIAVLLINEPDLGQDSGPFDGNALTYHGMLKPKLRSLIARGAIGALFVHDPAAAGWGWATARTSFAQPQFDVQGPVPQPRLRMEGWLSAAAAERLFRDSGLDPGRLRESAKNPGFRPVPLEARLSAAFAYRTDRVETRNVIGRLPGGSAGDEYLLYTAHWDHIGRGAPDGDRDVIYNGAVDNATGVAALL
jgi:hypothetical protein